MVDTDKPSMYKMAGIMEELAWGMSKVWGSMLTYTFLDAHKCFTMLWQLKLLQQLLH